MAPNEAKVINDKVERLLSVRSIHEVKYPNWLVNTVVVKKKNEKWRVCIDFTDLNKACPKDSFSLPHIDQLVEALSDPDLLHRLNERSGWRQPSLSRYLVPPAG